MRKTDKNENQFNIISYLEDHEQLNMEAVDATKLTHINYAFASIDQHKVHGNHLKKIGELKKLRHVNPQLNILISIGGLGAEGFSDAALTEASRKCFVDSAVTFMRTHNFDGIDIDWEYPGSSYAGIVSRPEDRENFTLMLKLLRDKLDEEGEKDDKYYMLTIAVVAGKNYWENTELEKIVQYLDYINIMTYDLVNEKDTRTGHHTNLYVSKKDPDRPSAHDEIEYLVKKGIPTKKLVLGAAFYGRGWSNVDVVNHGLNQESHSPDSDIFTFSTLTDNYIDKNGYVRYWDEDAKAPYLFDGNRFITYEDAESIKEKTTYVKSRDLGGIVFWEYTYDNKGVLQHALFNGLLKN
ncbi:glycoside hydrolase family 18 protein [Vallitalea pronyensis]|uniref:chitinase n=1 Tax=Vallitalea pronyensis TaxID=1348613 RepID=A0A8J8MKS3_9FIRM|nr:glycoside hydrolase family 18 protein [Vallitalea pronyensis]QUI23555.1 glycoside hydrolase family 18 protein [Vallitalea pronyensis]